MMLLSSTSFEGDTATAFDQLVNKQYLRDLLRLWIGKDGKCGCENRLSNIGGFVSPTLNELYHMSAV